MSAAPPMRRPSGQNASATNSMEWGREQARRARVAALVLELWNAVRRDQLSEYLQPIPITRLYSAQRAYFEVGALEAVHVLRWGSFSLKRVGARKPLPQAVAEMTAILKASTEDIEHLVAIYMESELERPDAPSGVLRPLRRLG